jgi:hypothetical protein
MKNRYLKTIILLGIFFFSWAHAQTFNSQTGQLVSGQISTQSGQVVGLDQQTITALGKAISVTGGAGSSSSGVSDTIFQDSTGQLFVYRDTGTGTPGAYSIPGWASYTPVAPVKATSSTLTNYAQETGGNLAAILAKLNSGIGVTGTTNRAWNLSGGTDSVTIVPSGTQQISGSVSAVIDSINSGYLSSAASNTAATTTAINNGSSQAHSDSQTLNTSVQAVKTAIGSPIQAGSTISVSQSTGTNLHTVIDSGSVTATINGTPSVTVSNLPGTQSVSNSGTFAVQNTTPIIGGNTIAVKVDNSGVTQPISGAVTANIGTTNGLALDSSIQAVKTAIGTPLQAGGSVSVSNFPATQAISGSVSVSNLPSTQVVSGTVTANAGTNLNTSALALESGGNLASINAKLTTTANGIKVDGSAVTQPVNVTSSTLPTGASTSALQGVTNTNLSTINTTLGSPMQNTGGLVSVIGNRPFSATLTIARPANTTAYTAGQLVSTATSGLTALPTFNLGIGSNQKAIVQNISVISSNGSVSTKGQFSLYLFNSPSPSGAGFNDGATFAPTATALSAAGNDLVGTIPSSINAGTAAYGYQLNNDTRQVITDSSGNIYPAIVLNNAYTPANAETITVVISGVY